MNSYIMITFNNVTKSAEIVFRARFLEIKNYL